MSPGGAVSLTREALAAAPPAERWAWLRAQIPATRAVAYLNCGWMGPVPLPVAEAMRARLALELAAGSMSAAAVDDRLAVDGQLRTLAERLLGAPAGSVALLGNTTQGMNAVLSGVEVRRGDALVTSTAEHGAGLVPLYRRAERVGAELRVVPCGPGDAPGAVVERFAEAIDGRTRLVLLSEIGYAGGQLMPLDAIAEVCHDRGARLLVDGAQSAGQRPINLTASGVDYYAAPLHKWLLGPAGVGLLYVRRDRVRELESAWSSDHVAESYDLAGHHEERRDAASKLELSTMSGVLLAGAVAAIALALDLDVAATWERARGLAGHAQARLCRIPGVELVSPQQDATRTGLVCFRARDVESAHLTAYLEHVGGVVARTVGARGDRPGVVRLSLHAYTTEAEVERAADCVERALREGVPSEIAAEAARERDAARWI